MNTLSTYTNNQDLELIEAIKTEFNTIKIELQKLNLNCETKEPIFLGSKNNLADNELLYPAIIPTKFVDCTYMKKCNIIIEKSIQEMYASNIAICVSIENTGNKWIIYKICKLDNKTSTFTYTENMTGFKRIALLNYNGKNNIKLSGTIVSQY